MTKSQSSTAERRLPTLVLRLEASADVRKVASMVCYPTPPDLGRNPEGLLTLMRGRIELAARECSRKAESLNKKKAAHHEEIDRLIRKHAKAVLAEAAQLGRRASDSELHRRVRAELRGQRPLLDERPGIKKSRVIERARSLGVWP